MNSDSLITTAVVPPAAPLAPTPQPVVASVIVTPAPSAVPVVAPAAVVAVKPQRKVKKQASSAARA